MESSEGGVHAHITAALSIDFRIFVTAKFFIGLVAGLFNILLPWLVLTLTGSPFITGIADGLISIPLLFSFIVGTFVDRQATKKALFVISMVGIALSFLIMGSAIDQGLYLEKIALIFIATLVIGFFDDIQDSVSSFFDKALLQENQIKKGMSLRRSVLTISTLIGYVASAFFISNGFYFTILSLVVFSLLPAAIIAPMKYERTPLNKEEKFRYSLMSGTILSSRFKGFGGRYLIGSIFLTGLMFLGIFYTASIKSYYPIDLLILLSGFLSGVINVFVNGAILKNTPKDMMARIFGSVKTLFVGFSFLSGAIAGILLSFITAPFIFVLVAAAFIFMGLLGQIRFKNLKQVTL